MMSVPFFIPLYLITIIKNIFISIFTPFIPPKVFHINVINRMV